MLILEIRRTQNLKQNKCRHTCVVCQSNPRARRKILPVKLDTKR